jgi:TCP-1/cpn60 chaperonin family
VPQRCSQLLLRPVTGIFHCGFWQDQIAEEVMIPSDALMANSCKEESAVNFLTEIAPSCGVLAVVAWVVWPRGWRSSKRGLLHRLPGGSIPLLRAIKALDGIKVENSDQRTGVEIVRKAIQSPAKQIIDNSGADGAVVVGKLIESNEYGYGYNAQTDEYGDLIKLGIIDPTKVVRTALQNAASVRV